MEEISGWTAPGWEAVRRAFEANFDDGREIGAAFSAYHQGTKVVDLWGGLADQKSGTPWEKDTLALVFSTTKGITAMCAHRLAEQKALDIGAPVAAYWPEFAAAGKEEITVAHLLSHRAGLAWVDGTMSLEDALAWTPVVEALARQAPLWKAGTDHGYHATTYGWLVGEVVSRVSGRSIGDYVREEISGPLGASFFIGLPAELEPKVARLSSFFDDVGSEPKNASAGELRGLAKTAFQYLAPDGALTKALGAPGGALSKPGIWNKPEVHQAQIPAANGICDARSLAQIYSACICDTESATGKTLRLIGAEQLERALVPQTSGPDRVLLGIDVQWGLGFMINAGVVSLSGMGGPRSFGHFGAGGSVGWADPDTGLAMGYVMNKMSPAVTGDPRSSHLARACRAAASAATT